MCTVTWWREPDVDAFGVWFNRDELRARPTSEPVQLQRAPDGTPYLAPRDPAAGGTWVLANAHGLVVGVLNFYAAAASHAVAPTRSRGWLPLQLAACRDVAEIEHALATIDRRAFAPFLLVAWDRARVARWAWDGLQLAPDGAPSAPLTTSSYRSGEICAWRRARYAEIVPQPTRDALHAFHDDTTHADPAFNVRMRRPDARTESVCRIVVAPGEIRFWHRREAPDALTALDVHEAVLVRS